MPWLYPVCGYLVCLLPNVEDIFWNIFIWLLFQHHIFSSLQDSRATNISFLLWSEISHPPDNLLGLKLLDCNGQLKHTATSCPWTCLERVHDILEAEFFFFCLFRATPAPYGGSQSRGPAGVVAAGLCPSHSHAGSELHLQPIPQLTATLDP